MKLSELPIKKLTRDELPWYFASSHYPYGNTYIECGMVKRGGNEPYCYPQEEACAGHICRVLCPDKTFDEALVIRDDSTVWKIFLSSFQEVWLLELEGGPKLWTGEE